MTRSYRAEQDISISAFDSSTEIELKMVVTFNVQPGSPATRIDPEEYPSVEVDAIRFFDTHAGDTAAIERALPSWLVKHLTDDKSFDDWLMREAYEQAEIDRDEAADARRDDDYVRHGLREEDLP